MVDLIVALTNMGIEEGIYSNDPKDHGGETYKGIARNFYPHWKGWVLVDSAKLQPNFFDSLANNAPLQLLVAEFYRIEYWNKISGDKLIYQNIANELLECSINMGIAAAVRIFQKSLNLLFDAKLKEDGDLGPITLKAYTLIFTLTHVCPYNLNRALLAAMLCLRGQRYVYIADQDENQRGFFRGWINRMLRDIAW